MYQKNIGRLTATCLLAAGLFTGSAHAASAAPGITVISEKLRALLDPASQVTVVAEGMQWSEGPVWIEAGADSSLLFSDTVRNRIQQWSEKGGLTVWMQPSGFPGADASAFREPGTNGLIRYDQDHLVAANHGQRQLTLIDLHTHKKIPLTTNYQGKLFNSPNDVVMSAQRDMYFTDPPYGLAGMNGSPVKQLSFSGVFRLGKDGLLSLIDDSLPFPNGIGLFPGAHQLLVSNTDPKNAVWKSYTLDDNGKVVNSYIFYDATAEAAKGLKGLPDGLKIDQHGNVFATGPGGIYIFSPAAELLGMINLETGASNVAFGGTNGSTLFITAGTRVLKVETLTKGLAKP